MDGYSEVHGYENSKIRIVIIFGSEVFIEDYAEIASRVGRFDRAAVNLASCLSSMRRNSFF